MRRVIKDLVFDYSKSLKYYEGQLADNVRKVKEANSALKEAKHQLNITGDIVAKKKGFIDGLKVADDRITFERHSVNRSSVMSFVARCNKDDLVRMAKECCAAYRYLTYLKGQKVGKKLDTTDRIEALSEASDILEGLAGAASNDEPDKRSNACWPLINGPMRAKVKRSNHTHSLRDKKGKFVKRKNSVY